MEVIYLIENKKELETLNKIYGTHESLFPAAYAKMFDTIGGPMPIIPNRADYLTFGYVPTKLAI